MASDGGVMGTQASATPGSASEGDQGSLGNPSQNDSAPMAPRSSSQESEATRLVREMNQQIPQSHRAALEQPAVYCAGEGEGTSFCSVLREFAASLRASTEIECIPKTQQLEPPAPKKKVKKPLSGMLPKPGKDIKNKMLGLLGFVEIPTQEEVLTREQQAAQEYNERAKAAGERGQKKLEEAGRTGDIQVVSEVVRAYYQIQATLQSAYYLQAGTYILTTTSKILLENIKATLAGSNVQMVVSLSDIYMSLLNNLDGALSTAWHLMDFVMDIMGTTLNQIAAERERAESFATDAFVKLNDLESLVTHTARMKAELTATTDKTANQVDALIKAQMNFRIYESHDAAVQVQIVERVLQVINSKYLHGTNEPLQTCRNRDMRPHQGPDAVHSFGQLFLFVAYLMNTGNAAASVSVTTSMVQGGPGGQPPMPPQQPGGYMFRFERPGEGGPAAAGGPAGLGGVGGMGFAFGPAAGAEVPRPGARAAGPVRPPPSPPTAAAPAPQVLATGLTEAEGFARQREQNSIQELGRSLASGNIQFHSLPADQAIIAQGTSFDFCQADVMLATPTEDEKRNGVMPGSCGARAAKAVDSLVTRRLQKVEWPPVTLFRTQADIEKYVKDLWKREKAKIADENSPAPSFYTLVSTGCASTSRDLRRQFWQAWQERSLFREISGNAIQSERLRKRVQLLVRDVLASFSYSANHALMVLDSMMKRAVAYALSFLNSSGDASQGGGGVSLGQNTSRREALNRSLEMFGSYANPQKKSKNPFDPSMVHSMLQQLETVSTLINMLAGDKSTANMTNLLLHTWVQARGLHNAAEGFKEKSSPKAAAKSTNVAAIFAKLWYDSTRTIDVTDDKLKPFGSAIVSSGLQIASFLHTVTEEYKASLVKQMGAAIKSFFASLFTGSGGVSLPSSWSVLQMRAMRQHRVNGKQYEGVLSVIGQLSKMFREMFLSNLYAISQPEALKALYLVFQALVAFWMNPFNEPFDLKSQWISPAKKLFYYNTFFHPKGTSFVAAKIIQGGCSAFGKSLNLGFVVDVKDSMRNSSKDANLMLTKKPLPLKNEKKLITSINKLMATYTDPMILVSAARDLAVRCKGLLSSPTGRERTTQSPSNEAEMPNQPATPSPPSEPTQAPSFEQQKFAAPKMKAKKAPVDPRAEEQVLASKLVVDMWCQEYKEMVLREMAGFKPSDSALNLQKQLDKHLEEITEISIAPEKNAKDRIISFKCQWMSGNNNQAAMRAERDGMMQYAISSGSFFKRLGKDIKKMGKLFKSSLHSIIRQQAVRPSSSRYGLFHAGTEVWTGSVYMWP
ncbi:hypothetical protein Efla_007250 [Eimeria flavescens]